MNSEEQAVSEYRSEPHGDLAAYALGALDPDHAARVEEMVGADQSLQDELDEMLETTALMAMRLGQDQAPPPSLRVRILQEAENEVLDRSNAPIYTSLIRHIERTIAPETDSSRGSLATRISSLFTAGRIALATSVASFAVVAILAVQLGNDNAALNRKVSDMEKSVQSSNSVANKMMDDMAGTEAMLVKAEQEIAEQSHRIEELTSINDALRGSINDQINLTYATLRNEYQAPSWLPEPGTEQGGYVYLLEHMDQPLAALVVGGMVQAPQGEEYRLYLIGEDGPWYAASFDMNEAGYSTVLFQLPHPLNQFTGAHITQERVDSAPDPTLADPANRYKPQ